MVYIPNDTEMKSKYQGRLAMDQDGTRAVPVRVKNPPRELNNSNGGPPSYIVNVELLENDGATPLAPAPGAKPFDATGFVSLDLSDHRFSQFIYAFFPEFKNSGGNFEPHMLTGRVAQAVVKYNEKREAEGYAPELRVIRWQPFVANPMASAPAPSPAPAPAAAGGVPDAPF